MPENVQENVRPFPAYVSLLGGSLFAKANLTSTK